MFWFVQLYWYRKHNCPALSERVGHEVLPEITIWLCIPQGFAGEVPVAPRVRVFHRLNGLPVNPQRFQVLHLQQHLWGKRTGQTATGTGEAENPHPLGGARGSWCTHPFSPPLAHQPLSPVPSCVRALLQEPVCAFCPPVPQPLLTATCSPSYQH